MINLHDIHNTSIYSDEWLTAEYELVHYQNKGPRIIEGIRTSFGANIKYETNDCRIRTITWSAGAFRIVFG